MSSVKKCNVCQKSDDNPYRHLMACANCKRYWHHTCHLPLITEEELLRRVRASTSKLPKGTLDDWLCRKCQNRAAAAARSGLESKSDTSTSTKSATTSKQSNLTSSLAKRKSDGLLPPEKTRRFEASRNVETVDLIDSDDEREGNAFASKSKDPEIIVLSDHSEEDIVKLAPTPIQVSAARSRAKQAHATNSSHLQSKHGRQTMPQIRPTVSRPASISAHSSRTSKQISRSASPAASAAPTTSADSSELLPRHPRSPLAVPKNNSAYSKLAGLSLSSSRSTSRAGSTGTPSGSASVPSGPTSTSSLPFKEASQDVQTSSNAAALYTVPDFRQILADMRAQGRLDSSPVDAAISRVIAYSSGIPTAPPSNSPQMQQSTRQWEKSRADTGSSQPNAMAETAFRQDSDGDIEMSDANQSETVSPSRYLQQPDYDDPNDIEDMYGDEAPARLPVKEEPHEDLALPISDHRELRPPDSRTLITFINRAEGEEEPDGWVRMLRNRETRVARREEGGIHRARKCEQTTRFGHKDSERKRETLEVVNFKDAPVELGSHSSNRWEQGIRTLEKLFG